MKYRTTQGIYKLVFHLCMPLRVLENRGVLECSTKSKFYLCLNMVAITDAFVIWDEYDYMHFDQIHSSLKTSINYT